MNNNRSISIPAGVRDMLPREVSMRRRVEEKIRKIALEWGYGEVITPTIEYFDFVSRGIGENRKESMIRFFDDDGQVLGLRMELTAPIARMAAMRFLSGEFPLRLFYMANVFSKANQFAGKRRERLQAGVEIVGSGSLKSDFEAVALLINMLNEVLGDGYRIGLGHIDVIDSALEETFGDLEMARRLKKSLLLKNLVEVSKQLPQAKRQSVLELISLKGNHEVMTEASCLFGSEKYRSGLDKLAHVYSELKKSGYGNRIFIDLGIVRSFDYYTGLVFEGYALGSGVPICGGGRYDNLLSYFGIDSRAVGFAIDVDVIHELNIGTGQCSRKPTKISIMSDDGNFTLAIKLGIILRNRGLDAEAVLEGTGKEDVDIKVVIGEDAVKIYFISQDKKIEVDVASDFKDVLNAIENSGS
ncbi:MAG: ATP phosphoribosyltransferase regulatory subunit [Actinobacteria bacterium]|nr:ATP phosphoribosyltransferase regulatory subunit [Actinomycetota bacterium]